MEMLSFLLFAAFRANAAEIERCRVNAKPCADVGCIVEAGAFERHVEDVSAPAAEKMGVGINLAVIECIAFVYGQLCRSAVFHEQFQRVIHSGL